MRKSGSVSSAIDLGIIQKAEFLCNLKKKNIIIYQDFLEPQVIERFITPLPYKMPSQGINFLSE